jgi:hypothetical protein
MKERRMKICIRSWMKFERTMRKKSYHRLSFTVHCFTGTEQEAWTYINKVITLDLPERFAKKSVALFFRSFYQNSQ